MRGREETGREATGKDETGKEETLGLGGVPACKDAAAPVGEG